MNYETVIGLEVHVQLDTASKLFCACSTDFGATPNSQTCPVCQGLPGVLPVLNEKAMDYSIKTALALNCTVSNLTKFDRKHYYYPDLPKNFQISQYDLPIALNGGIEIETEGKVKYIRIKRVHLEEDAGKLIHCDKNSLVDLNRTGIPLLEIVSEPDLSSAEEAYQYLTNLKAIIEYLDVSDCDMEKGSLRCDANISLRKKGEKTLGVKAEVKNMNSFKGVRAALEYEEKRQKEVLEQGERIVQETRLWDDMRGQTFPMRSKEEAHDYRYFPEPDLLPYTLSEEKIGAIKNTLPELPDARKKRLITQYCLNNTDAAALVSDRALTVYFEQCVKIYNKPKNILNWLISDVMAQLNSRNTTITGLGLSPENLTEMIKLIDDNIISGKIAKDILPVMIETKKMAAVIIKEKGLSQISSEDELGKIADEVIVNNKKTVDDFLNGNENAVMFLVGQMMKKTKSRANPKIVQELLKNKLKKISK